MDEILDIVDDQDNVVGKGPRKDIKKRVLPHRLVKIVIINGKGEVLVHMRSSSKDTFPSHWDLGCAETLQSGESYEEAAHRGLKEEFGIDVNPAELKHAFLFRYLYRTKEHQINYKIYNWFFNDSLTIQDEEVEEAKFLPIEEVKKLIKKGPFHGAAAQIFEHYLKIKELS